RPPRHLRHKDCGVRAQAQYGDAQSDVLGEGYLVLPQRIVDRREPELVLEPVDLDVQPQLVPVDVEVAAYSCTTPYRLVLRLRQPVRTTHPGECQLAEALDTGADVSHDLVKVRSSPGAVALAPTVQQVLPAHEALLDRHGEARRSLTVRASPLRG